MVFSAGPNPDLAIGKYRSRAWRYDASARRTFALRRRSIALLCLKPGERVLDVACGTGLSFPMLRDGVGDTGFITGVDVSADMAVLAERRVAAVAWRNVRVVTAPMETAPLDGPFCAALFNYTHDVLQSPAALANILAHLRPGARVALAGIKHPSVGLYPLRWWRILKARPYVTTLNGLDAPWTVLLSSLEDFRVSTFMLGTNYIASARVRRVVATGRG